MAGEVNAKQMVAVFEQRWKKNRPFKTVSLLVTFFSLGLSTSVLGPTIVSMEVLLNTSTEYICSVFTGGAVGYLLGSVFCGLVYSRLNKELLFAASLIGISVNMAYLPFSPFLIIFILVNSVQSFFMGIIDTAGQSYLLKTWQDHRHRRPLMQTLHCLWSAGATVGPFIVEIFLVELPRDSSERTDDSATASATEVYENMTEVVSQTDGQPPPNVGLVRLAYVVAACIVATSSLLFMVLFFVLGPSCLDRSREKDAERRREYAVGRTKRYKRFYAHFLLCLAFWYFFILWVEGIPGSLVSVFVVKGLGWQNDLGARVTALYWGTHGLARVMGIPLAAILSPRTMLIVDMLTLMVGSVLLFLVDLHPAVIWLAVSAVGLGVGSVFPSGILWAEEFIEITGVASSVILTASSAGSMIGPAFTGFLIGRFTHLCFVYVYLTAVVFLIAIYVTAAVYARSQGFVNHKSRKSSEHGGSPAKQQTNSLTDTGSATTRTGDESLMLE